ncbi:MAG: choice-of-anchor D domain-containing protein, partial [Candidatus Kapabacteria bacterium]|nr:choice-of-anchor D domain-containing protein [Candidatus Kapabacteria bacterium]
DNGNSWSLLQDNVTNTFEVWVPTPDKIGNQNKVRVSHLKYPNQTTLPLNHGHAPQVKQIVLNPQNPNYAVVCLVPDILMPQCRRAYVINLQTGDTVATLTAPNNRIINNVVWSSDGSTIYTCQNGTGGGQVSVWNASTYQIIRSFGESLMWSAIAVNPGGNRIVVGVTNLVNNVKVYDTGSGTLLQTISNHTNAVTACAYSQDGTRFATSDASGRVNIRNASTYQLVGTFDVSPSCVATSVNFNPTQTDHVVVSYDCGETKIWSTASQSVQQTITGNIGRHYYATYIANSTQLLICGELEQNGTQFRGASMLWNILAQTQAAVFDGAGKVNRHSWRTYAAAITPSGQNIITANHHGGINIWSITGAHSRQIIPRSIRGAMMSCDVTTNDQRVATLGEDGSVAVHSVQSRDTIRYCYGLENNSNRHSTMRFSPDGNYIAASSDSNDVAVWNSQTGALIVRHPRAGYGVCFTPNSQSYAIVSDSTVRFYATATGTFQRQITIANTIAGRDIQFNADGSQIFVAAIASGGRTVVVKANATNGAQILRFTDDIATNGECARLSYSKGLGRCAVVHIPTQRTYILDSSMQRIRTVNHPLYDMSQSTMYGVGMTVPAAQLSAWNTETGATIRTANPHSTTSINNAAIFSTNARSVSVGSDGNAFLWDYALAPIQADTSDAPFVIGLHNIVKKDSINWGQLLVRTQRDSVITQIIRNTGTSWGLVDSVRILGFNMIDFEIVNTSTQYYDYVYPGQQRDYELRFTPHSLGFKTAVLRIYMRCDTVNIILTGEAVNPPTESPMTLIDFGQVEITTQKDTTVDAIIKNVSNRPLSVTSVKIGAPDTTQFSITNGGGAFTLQPNQTRRMTLRFAPVRTGRTSAQLIMNHNGVASPATLQLAGEGVRIPRLQPVRDSVMLQIPLCSQSLSTDTIATLFSPGTGDAIVQSAEIIGADSLAFSIVNYSTPDTILATRSRQITVRLSTTQAAVKRAVLRLRTNAQTSVNGVVDIPLIGRRDTATLAFDFGGLQLLNVPPNTAIDTALYVNNTGTQPVQLTLPQTVGKFIIRSCVPNPIPPAVRARIAVRFTGGDTSSLSDTVYKVGLPCSATLQTRLQAYVQSPAPVLVSVPSIVANTNPCTGTLDTALILRNSGMRALDISRIAISGKDAPSIMLLRQPIVIPSNGADTILIRFTPPTDMKPGDEANATVIIFSNAANANSGSTVIPLRIRYAIMRHAIDTPLVDFTNLIPSTPATKQLTIRNTGSVPLPCVLPQQSGQFSITSVTPNPIPAGGTGVATVRFAGAPQGTLALDSIALTDGCNRSTVVQCRANVQSMRPVLATTQSQTFNVACVSTLDTVLVLRNLG